MHEESLIAPLDMRSECVPKGPEIDPLPIAIFSPTISAGGSEKVLAMLASGFVGKGHPVERLVAHQRERQVCNDSTGNVLARGLGARRVLGTIGPLAKLLKNERPRCLLSSLTYANIVAIVAVLLSRSSVPVIVREAINVSAYAKLSSSRRNRILPWLVRLFYRHADVVIAPSEGVRDDLVRNLGVRSDKVKVIYNPVDTDAVKKASSLPLDHPWFRNKTVPIVVSVARLDESKDFETLVEAASIVNARQVVHFVVVGDGPERNRIESLIVEHGVNEVMHLVGHQNNPYRFIKQADLFVHASRAEGLPNVVIEALVLGQRIVSTDCPSGPREILEDGKHGRLVPMRDPSSMAIAILDALGSRDNVDYVLAVRRFSLERVIESYINVVKEVVADRRR